MTQTIKPTILFKRPDTIDAVVEFPLPTGDTAKLACKFIYRTRAEFGSFWDEISKAGDAKKDKAGKDGDFSFAALMAQGDRSNAQHALRFIASWPDDMPKLTADTLEQVFNEAPAAAPAFWEAYRNLCTVGRLGN